MKLFNRSIRLNSSVIITNIMSFKLEAFNFETEIDSENFESKYPIIKFVCSLNEYELFTFIPEQGKSANSWNKMATSCIDGGTCISVDWSPCNGESNITIDAKNKTVNFQVAKYGDGCGGDLNINIPSEACINAFQKAEQITNEWIKNKEQKIF